MSCRDERYAVAVPMGVLGLAWLLAGPAGETAGGTHTLEDAIDVAPGATCLDEARLLDHVGRWLGRTKIDARIRVEVTGHETRTDVASFRVTRGEGRVAERTLDPAPLECADLHAGLAFAIALGIDASILEDFGVELPGEPQPTAVEPDRPAGRPAVQPDAPAKRAEADTEVSMGLRAAGMAGLVGNASAGGELRFDVALPSSFSLGVSGVGAVGFQQPLGPGSFRASGAAGRVDGCYARRFPSVYGRFCGGFAAGAIVGRGQGFATSQRAAEPWLWVAAGAHLRLPADGRVGVGIGADFVVPILRPRFVLRDDSGNSVATERLPPVGGILFIGLEFRLR